MRRQQSRHSRTGSTAYSPPPLQEGAVDPLPAAGYERGAKHYTFHLGETVLHPRERGMCATIGRVPWLTLLGVLLVAAGSACVMYGYKSCAGGLYRTYTAIRFNDTLSDKWCADCQDWISEEADKEDDSYYSPENPTYIIVDSVLCGVGVLALLLLAVLGTGLTRDNCCATRPCCQCYCMFSNTLAAAIVMMFLAVFLAAGTVLLLPAALSVSFNADCDNNERPCLDVAKYGFQPPQGTNSTEVCFGDDRICDRMHDMMNGLAFMCGGSYGAFLGFIFVLMALAANFAHFNDMRHVDSEEKYSF